MRLKGFELQHVVSLKVDGKKEYGVVVELVRPGCVPHGGLAQYGRQAPHTQASCVVRVDYQDGRESKRHLVPETHLDFVYMPHAEPRK